MQKLEISELEIGGDQCIRKRYAQLSWLTAHVLLISDLEPVDASRLMNGQQDALLNDNINSTVTDRVAMAPVERRKMTWTMMV